MRRFTNLLGTVPLIAWYVWGLARDIPPFVEHFFLLRVGGQVNALLALQTFAQASSIVFISLLVVLLIVRDMPRARSRGFAPYLATMIGTFTTATFLFLPTVALPAPLLAIAASCIIAGFGLSVYTLIYLGRSFALLPSARALVTDGPYRLVRHPLYLFEEIAILGIMIQLAQPWALLVMAVSLSAQFARMHYEERVLSETFPEYAAYASRTKRLIPGVY
jgi:protein-S-isoprenylcysteine O-methyltransferase Ste14